MITDRIGRHEVLLAINHKYYTFRGSWNRKNMMKNLENYTFMILIKILVFKTCKCFIDYFEVCDWFISDAILLVLGLSV